MSMQSVMAQDLAYLFEKDIPTTAIITLNGQTKEYTVLLDDLQNQEADAFGGPEIENMRRIHFLTTDLPSVENGTIISILEPSPTPGNPILRKKIVMSSVTSADGNELIATVRGA